MDARAFEGNFLFSLGPNNEAGGSRTTACHIDIPLRNCTVRLDGEDVVTRGVVQDGFGTERWHERQRHGSDIRPMNARASARRCSRRRRTAC